MKTIDPGHEYELDCLDKVDGWAEEFSRLRFVKRVGDGYLGNEPPGHDGTTSQEVLRALIERARYVDAQRPSLYNARVVEHLREALRMLEARAAVERGDHAAAVRVVLGSREPELEPTCDTCGNVFCSTHR